jgi:hypothetical protein
MTIETVDLHNKVRAARTYFTRKNLVVEKDVESVLDDYNVPQEYNIFDVAN